MHARSIKNAGRFKNKENLQIILTIFIFINIDGVKLAILDSFYKNVDNSQQNLKGQTCQNETNIFENSFEKDANQLF